jgi:hypothetical protein
MTHPAVANLHPPLLIRGVIVYYEAIWQSCRKCSQQDANLLRRRRPRPGEWHTPNMTSFLLTNPYYWHTSCPNP